MVREEAVRVMEREAEAERKRLEEASPVEKHQEHAVGQVNDISCWLAVNYVLIHLSAGFSDAVMNWLVRCSYELVVQALLSTGWSGPIINWFVRPSYQLVGQAQLSTGWSGAVINWLVRSSYQLVGQAQL